MNNKGFRRVIRKLRTDEEKDVLIKELVEALARLASPQAFGLPFYPKDDQASKELALRMEYAGEILVKAKGKENE